MLARRRSTVAGFGSIAITVPVGPTARARGTVNRPMFAPASTTVWPGRTRPTAQRSSSPSTSAPWKRSHPVDSVRRARTSAAAGDSCGEVGGLRREPRKHLAHDEGLAALGRPVAQPLPREPRNRPLEEQHYAARRNRPLTCRSSPVRGSEWTGSRPASANPAERSHSTHLGKQRLPVVERHERELALQRLHGRERHRRAPEHLELESLHIDLQVRRRGGDTELLVERVEADHVDRLGADVLGLGGARGMAVVHGEQRAARRVAAQVDRGPRLIRAERDVHRLPAWILAAAGRECGEGGARRLEGDDPLLVPVGAELASEGAVVRPDVEHEADLELAQQCEPPPARLGRRREPDDLVPEPARAARYDCPQASQRTNHRRRQSAGERSSAPARSPVDHACATTNRP